MIWPRSPRGPVPIGGAVTFLGLLCACGNRGSFPANAPPTTSDPVLRPPSELAPDLVVEQHVEASKDGATGAFDAVVQKRGAELLLIGLGPMGVRAFVVEQVGSEIRFEQRIGPPLPFPVRNVVVDVHRVFFKRLPSRGATPDGERRGRVDDEDVVELWTKGSLVERSFSRPTERTGTVRVLYGPGCTALRCEPRTVRLINGWFGYELRIENRRFHSLD